jgi:hypothetical protein
MQRKFPGLRFDVCCVVLSPHVVTVAEISLNRTTKLPAQRSVDDRKKKKQKTLRLN